MEVPLLINDFLRRAAKLYPDKTAIVDGASRFTYREYQERANQLAHALLELGVKQGDRVCILSPNSHFFLESYYGVTQIGAILVPLNYRLVGRRPRVHHQPRRREGRARRLRVHEGRRRDPAEPDDGRALDRRAGRRRGARTAGPTGSTLIAGAADDGDAARRAGRERRHLDQLHVRHDGAAEGRDADAPQLLHQRLQLHRPPAASGTTTSSCGRCRCSTPTAGAARSRSRRWARTHVVLRAVNGPRHLPADRGGGRDVRLHGARRAQHHPQLPRQGEAQHHDAAALRRRRRAAARRVHRAAGEGARLGVHPDLRPDRDGADPHRLARPTSHTDDGDYARRARAGVEAIGVDIQVLDDDGQPVPQDGVSDRRGLRALERRPQGLLGAAGGDREGDPRRLLPHRRPRASGTSSATSTSSTARRT